MNRIRFKPRSKNKYVTNLGPIVFSMSFKKEPKEEDIRSIIKMQNRLSRHLWRVERKLRRQRSRIYKRARKQRNQL